MKSNIAFACSPARPRELLARARALQFCNLAGQQANSQLQDLILLGSSSRPAEGEVMVRLQYWPGEIKSPPAPCMKNSAALHWPQANFLRGHVFC